MSASRPPRPVAVAVAVLGAVVLVGCSSAPVDPAPTADDERAAAIVRTRQQVVEPAQALGTTAAGVATQLEALVARPGDDTIEAVRGAVDDLEDAREAVSALDVAADTEDVRAAAEALAAASEGAGVLAEAATTTASVAARATEADGRLDQLVAAWDEPGSYSQLLARFAETGQQAAALADDLAGAEVADCPGPVRDRAAAARHVAEATADLRDLVERRDGLGFDDRRAQLAEAPFGEDDAGDARELGGPIDPAACPTVEEAMGAASEVAAALQSLQRALNPEDLT